MTEGRSMPWLTDKELEQIGVGIAYYPILPLVAAIYYGRHALKILKEEGMTKSILTKLSTVDEIAQLVRDDQWRAMEKRKDDKV